MRAEIIAVGTELLLGQIVNTNAQYLSEQLAKLGVNVYYHTVVGDNRKRLKQVIHQAEQRADVLIFSGGLGPTEDDLTREIVSEVTGVPLLLHPPSLSALDIYFAKRGRQMTANNRKQAFAFEGGTVFANENGTAPGLAMAANNRHYILLPGPPRELQPMFDKGVRSYLQRLQPHQEIVHSRVLNFFGIGESQLETEIIDLIRKQHNPTIAPLAKEGEVTLRLTARATTIAEAEELISSTERDIRRRVGTYIYGTDDDSLAKVVVNKLLRANKTLAVAESCSGGLLSNMVTAIPGSSAAFLGGIVCYSVTSKQDWLGVPAAIIREHGTVSEVTAKHLAERVKGKLATDYGIGVTGIAGPDAIEDKPVGLVYVALARPDQSTIVKALQLRGLRDTVQTSAAKQALFLLHTHLH